MRRLGWRKIAVIGALVAFLLWWAGWAYELVKVFGITLMAATALSGIGLVVAFFVDIHEKREWLGFLQFIICGGSALAILFALRPVLLWIPHPLSFFFGMGVLVAVFLSVNRLLTFASKLSERRRGP